MVKTKGINHFTALLVAIFMIVGMFAGMTSSVSAANASSINTAGSSVYGNFETAGVIIKVDNMNFNETATIEYKKTTDSTYKTGHYFVRYDGNHMATSLFNLTKNTTYDIRVTLSDPDGVTGTNPWTTTVTTKPEYSIPTPLRIVNVSDSVGFDTAIRNSQPGDEIRLAAGTYTTGWDYYTQGAHSGTAVNPIVITSQTGTKPLFLGTGFLIMFSSYVILNNLEIHNEGGYGVNLNGSDHCTVSNCYVHDSASDPNEVVGDISINHGSSNNLIINNIASDDDHGSWVAGNNAPTANQTYYGIATYFSAGAFNTIRGNTVYGVVDGIQPGSDEGQQPPSDTDLDVLNSSFPQQNYDVYDNYIYNCSDDGIQADGHMVNGRVFRNHIGTCTCAISTAPVYPGPEFYVWNTVYGFQEQCSKANTTVPGVTRNCFFYNNTFVERDRTQDTANGISGYCYYKSDGNPAQASGFTYKNNIFYARGRVYNGDLYTPGGFYTNWNMDYNTVYSDKTCMQNGDFSVLYKWASVVGDSLNNTKYANLAAFSSATGEEAHGTYGWPALDFTPKSGYPANSDIADLKILGGSAAIDKGVVIPGITDGYKGAAPDCGVYETDGTEPPGPTAPPVPTPTPTPIPTPTPTPIDRGSGTTISNLGVFDFNNASDWSVQQSLQEGNTCFGDRTATYGQVPTYLQGKEYIKPANDSKAYAGSTLCTFTVSGDTDVYVLHNNSNGDATGHPAWLTSNFTDTGDNMTVGGNGYSIFKKTYAAGSRVDLGDNGNTGMSTYVIVVSPASGGTPTPTTTPTPTPTTTPTPTPTTTIVNDNSLTFGSGWTYDNSGTRASNYNGDITLCSADNSYVQYTFTGTKVEYINDKANDLGDMDIYIDNMSTPVATVNCYNATRLYQQVLYSSADLVSGSHTIKIVKKNGNYATIDALKIYSNGATPTPTPTATPTPTPTPTATPGQPTIINDDASGVSFNGSWNDSNGRGMGDYNDDVHYTTNNNDYFQYTFTGTGVDYITEKNSDEGNVDIYIDGTFQQSVNCNAGSRQAQQTVYSKTGLSSGSHTIKCVKTSGSYMLFDALKIYSGGSTTINDNLLTFGSGWTYDNGGLRASDYNGDITWCTANSSYVQYTFTGTGVDYINDKASDLGDVDIYIDNMSSPVATVSSYNATRLCQQVIYSNTGLSAGSHTIKIVKKNGSYASIDALKIYN